MTNQPNTTYRSFDEMTDDPEWLGWGYLGGRRSYLADVDDTSGQTLEQRQAEVAAADVFVTDIAGSERWTDAELFRWANSRPGRHFADSAFGGGKPDGRCVMMLGPDD